MPHDKRGILLTVGALVSLRGTVLSIDSEQETYCNITFLPEIGMAPEQPASPIVLSARMVEAIAPAGELRPYLYIEDVGRSMPVIQSGFANTNFIYCEKLNKHVHRFTSIDDFRARARDIINDEQSWKIFPGLEVIEPEPVPPAAETEYQRSIRLEDELFERIFGIDKLPHDLPPDLARTYADLILPVRAEDVSDFTVKLTRHEGDFGSILGLGFEVAVAGEIARQGVILTRFPSAEDKVSAVEALAAYFRAPDRRLVIGEVPLMDNTLPLLRSADGKFSIPPIVTTESTPPPASESTAALSDPSPPAASAPTTPPAPEPENKNPGPPTPAPQSKPAKKKPAKPAAKARSGK